MMGTCLALTSTPATGQDTPAVMQAMRQVVEAGADSRAENFGPAIEKLQAAAELREDLPRVWARLAAVQAAAGQPAAAAESLARLAALGISVPAEELDEISALYGQPEYAEVMKQLAANMRSKGRGEIAFLLRDVTGLIEGIAWREATGRFYFGDVNARAVWMREADGSLRRLTPEDDVLLGVQGLLVDETQGVLWAATAAVRGMQGFSPDQEGRSALVEIDLADGAVRRTYDVPESPAGERAHRLGDLARTEDGTIYITDGGEPVIWRLAPGGGALERFAQSAEFLALQGIVIHGGAAVVADRLNGLLRVDLADGTVMRMETPENSTLVGLDGLVAGPEGAILAMQSGTRPTRILLLEVSPDADVVESVTILESGHLNLAAPSQGCIGPDGDLYFIGNPGWPRFEASEGEPSAPRPVPVFKTKLSPSR